MKQIIRSVLQTHLNQLGQFNTAWEGVLNAQTTISNAPLNYFI